MSENSNTMYRPKSSHPSGMSWRDRELVREKERKETEIRTKEAERMKTLNPTEDNFPSLGGAFQKPKPVTQPGMFAKLASEWRDHEEVEKAREQREREEEERRRREFRPRMGRASPNHYDRRYIYDDCDAEELARPHTPKYGYEEENWNIVEYKHRAPAENRMRYFQQGDDDPLEEELNAELAELGIRDY